MKADFDEAMLEEMLRLVEDQVVIAPYAEESWNRFLQTFDRMSAGNGAPVSPSGAAYFVDNAVGYLSIERMLALENFHYKAAADVAIDWARRWHAHCLKQAERGRAGKRNKKLARLVDDMAGSQHEGRDLREMFNDVVHLGDMYELTTRWSDDDNVIEWDDLDADRCGELTFKTYKRWLNNARKKRGSVDIG